MKTDKHTLLQHLNEAYASGDTGFIGQAVTDDIRWILAGSHAVNGKAAFVKEMASMAEGGHQEIIVSKIITHGLDACVEGIVKMKTPAGVDEFAFCDVYKFNKFKDGLVKEITSYVVSVKPSKS